MKKSKVTNFGQRWFELDSGVYPARIFVSIGYNNQYAAKRLNIKLSDMHPQSTGGATTYDLNDGRYLLSFSSFSNDVQDLALLSHEVFHLTFMVLRNAGLTLSHDSEEAYAYLLQYIVESFLKKL